MLTSWSNYIIAISHSKMGTNKHSRINLTNAFLCSIYCAKCFQTWKGAGSYHWSRNTSCVKKKKKAEVVFFRAEKMNLFYPLLSWLYTKQQNCAQICYVFGFHYSSLQTHPQLTANIVPHDAAQKCDCPQEPKPVIYYLAVFCLTWVHSASLTVALSQAASPYL